METLKKYGCSTISYELKGSLFFGTTDALINEIEKDIDTADRYIFDFSRVSDIDLSGVKILLTIVERLHDKGYRVLFSGVEEPKYLTTFSIFAMLTDTGVISKVGKENIFVAHDLALVEAEEAILQKHHENYIKDRPALELGDFELFQNLSETETVQFRSLLVKRSLEPGRIFICQW